MTQFPSIKRLETRIQHRRVKIHLSNKGKQSLLDRYEEFLASGKPIAKVTPFILATICLSGFLPVALLMPKLASFFCENRLNERKRDSLYTALSRAKKHGFIRTLKKDNETYFSVTVLGEEVLYRELLKGVSLIPQKKWDHVWRIVIFDFPVKNNFLRDLFRNKIREWNFQPLQKSVFISPWPCFSELTLLREALRVNDCVLLVESGFLEEEEKWQKYFKI